MPSIVVLDPISPDGLALLEKARARESSMKSPRG